MEAALDDGTPKVLSSRSAILADYSARLAVLREAQKQGPSAEKRRRGAVFIDGQNIGHGVLDKIKEFCCSKCVELDGSIYRGQNDSNREYLRWCEDNGYRFIPVLCKPKKNSVDIKIAVDSIYTCMTDSEIKTFFLSTNDSDFTHITSKLLSLDREVFLIHSQEQVPDNYSPLVEVVGVQSGAKSVSSSFGAVARAAKGIIAGVTGSSDGSDNYADRGNIASTRKNSHTERALIGVSSEPHGSAQKDDHVKELLQAESAEMTPLPRAYSFSEMVAASPFGVTASIAYREHRKLYGKSWKVKSSRKTAEQFCRENFPDGSVVFINDEQSSSNDGWFVNREYAGHEYSDVRSYMREVWPECIRVSCCSRSLLRNDIALVRDVLLRCDQASFLNIEEATRQDRLGYFEHLRATVLMLVAGGGLTEAEGKGDDFIREIAQGSLKMEAEFSAEEMLRIFQRGFIFCLTDDDLIIPDNIQQRLGQFLDLPSEISDGILRRHLTWVRDPHAVG